MRGTANDTRQSEHTAKPGFYINTHSLEMGIADGPTSASHVRMPTLLVFIVAPLLGAMFAIFLPFIGMWCATTELTKAMISRFKR